MSNQYQITSSRFRREADVDLVAMIEDRDGFITHFVNDSTPESAFMQKFDDEAALAVEIANEAAANAAALAALLVEEMSLPANTGTKRIGRANARALDTLLDQVATLDRAAARKGKKADKARAARRAAYVQIDALIGQILMNGMPSFMTPRQAKALAVFNERAVHAEGKAAYEAIKANKARGAKAPRANKPQNRKEDRKVGTLPAVRVRLSNGTIVPGRRVGSHAVPA
jgi:hypothetical protein